MEGEEMFEGLLRINPIDKLIATEVMGWRLCHYGFWETEFGELDSESEWSPSEDIADAWKVVEKLQVDWNVNVGTANPYSKRKDVARKIDKYYCEVYGEKEYVVYAETSPMAICIAALKAYGIEVAE
jgi:hypothetical protein